MVRGGFTSTQSCRWPALYLPTLPHRSKRWGRITEWSTKAKFALISYVGKQQGVQGVKQLPHCRWLIDFTAKLTFDRCLRVCTCESLELGLVDSVFSITKKKERALQKKVASLVLWCLLLLCRVVGLVQHCSQTGLHGEKPKKRWQRRVHNVLCLT